MNINRIVIKNLFDLYSYDLDLGKNRNLTILTGPNGYGKTTILLIINNLSSKNFHFFQKLSFESIQLYLDKNYSIIISKRPIKNNTQADTASNIDSEVKFELFAEEKKITTLIFDPTALRRAITNNSYLRYDKNQDIWIDRRNEYLYTTEEYIEKNPKVLESIDYGTSEGEFLLFLNSVNSYLIKDQRLSSIYRLDSWRSSESKTEPTVKKSASELEEIIKDTQLKSLKETQELDSTFPERLLNNSVSLPVEEYQKRFAELQKKQELLREFNLSNMTQSQAEYNDNNQRILSIYLSDAEKKISVFNELVEKLQLFTGILNKKEFAMKNIRIDAEKGFVFKTIKGKSLDTENLSSGEQHELILLYDLLFHVKPGTIVLIDEPEISLHVSWQQEFIKDIQEITNTKNIQLIIATHSPQIIGNNWDLCYDLFDQIKGL